MFNKIYLILIIALCISCKEKTKPFTFEYNHVELVKANSCWGGDLSCKVDSNKFFYIPDNAIFNNWVQPVTIGRLSDSIQEIIDSIAYKVYNYKDKTIKTDCIGCTEYAVIVVKDSVKKTYYSDQNKFIDGDIFLLLERLNKLKGNKNFRVKDISIFIEAREIVKPPLPPPPPAKRK